jgi:FliI/YscN family ATPase
MNANQPTEGGAGFHPAAGSQPARPIEDRPQVTNLPRANASESVDLSAYIGHLDGIEVLRWSGVVAELVGLLIESRGPAAPIGSFCEILASSGKRIRTQVVGFRNGRVLSIPLEETDGLQLGDRIVARLEDARVGVGRGLLGRVIDGFGLPMDDGPRLQPSHWYDLYPTPPSPLTREHIRQPLFTGIRAIDSLLPCGEGQRVGLFGGSGVGKSTLLGAMARGNSADVTVIALIGERNREVRGFLENELGPEGRKRSVVVVATSDRPAPLRVRACHVALSVAEYFRDQGANVLFVMDSVTRLAMAQREIGLAAGEPPSQKGYTPSVFNLMPRIFERAGAFPKGTITGFFTVLVEGDDFNEPICDAVRGLLDGHIVLSRQLGSAGHYPAIDVLGSVSRVSKQVSTPEQLACAQKVREALATYQRSEDLIQLGAYVSGTNSKLDASIKARDRMMDFLRQDSREKSSFEDTMAGLQELAHLLP